MARRDAALASMNIPYKNINTLVIPADTLTEKALLKISKSARPSIDR